MAKTFIDSEFGEVSVSFRTGSRAIRVSVGTDGRLKVSAPKYTPLLAVKATIATMRPKIRHLFTPHITPAQYVAGQQIGKSHHLVVVPGTGAQPAIRVQGQNIILRLPQTASLEQAGVQRLVRDTVIKVLRIQAKAYLPRRIKQLAEDYGFTYERVRLSHAGTRWGSCSTTGTISLNIGLMKLPGELIDYVLIHELAHTHHMDHSTAFWELVSRFDPAYTLHRKQLKLHTPSV